MKLDITVRDCTSGAESEEGTTAAQILKELKALRKTMADQNVRIQEELAELRESQTALRGRVETLISNNEQIKTEVSNLRTALGDAIDETEAATIIATIDEITADNDTIAAELQGEEEEPTEGENPDEDLPTEEEPA
jgi:regulator of replication initiation timing